MASFLIAFGILGWSLLIVLIRPLGGWMAIYGRSVAIQTLSPAISATRHVIDIILAMRGTSLSSNSDLLDSPTIFGGVDVFCPIFTLKENNYGSRAFQDVAGGRRGNRGAWIMCHARECRLVARWLWLEQRLL